MNPLRGTFDALQSLTGAGSLFQLTAQSCSFWSFLFLEGLPNLQNLGKLRIGEDVEEIFNNDLALEMDALPTLKDGIRHCEKVGDFVSRELLEEILGVFDGLWELIPLDRIMPGFKKRLEEAKEQADAAEAKSDQQSRETIDQRAIQATAEISRLLPKAPNTMAMSRAW